MGLLKRRIIEAMEPKEEPPMTAPLGWIAVTERLPEDGEDVLVRIRYGHKFVCAVAYRVSGNDCWTISVGDFFDFPNEQATHWMPLPEPPEVK